LYRAVSQDELDQIERTSRFAVVGGGAEGKYFWEKRYDAEWFATKYGLASVVRARYHVDAIRHFYRWERLDGRGAARFAVSC
jgi:hypothetical protein